MEVRHGIEQYEAGDPDTLVLGSSHARAFGEIERVLAERTGGQHQLVRLPVEWGKHSSYSWVVQNRLRPLIEEEEEDAAGKLRRPSLSRLIYVTEWWDGCAPEGGLAFNLPSRAWQLRHFLSDFVRNGLTPHNRNYVSRRLDRLLRWSILAQDRGVERVPTALMELLRPPTDLARQAEWQKRIDWWHGMLEGAFTDPLCRNGTELAAMTETVDYFQSRGVEVTILLMARMPATVTEKGKRTTFARYARQMRALADSKGARFIDLTFSTPLADEHFMSDFDHADDEGNRIFASWGLSGDLAFLLDEPPRRGESP